MEESAYYVIPFIWSPRTGQTNIWQAIEQWLLLRDGIGTGNDWEGTWGNCVGWWKCSIVIVIGIWVTEVYAYVKSQWMYNLDCTHHIIYKFYIRRKKNYWEILNSNEIHAEMACLLNICTKKESVQEWFLTASRILKEHKGHFSLERNSC